MPTSEPGQFSERGDRAEAAAYRGDGVYSGGEFAGGDPVRYDRLSGAVQGVAGDAGTAVPDDGASGEGRDDVESRDLQHTSLEENADRTGHAAGRA